jgi:hypothetical protein
MFIENLDEPTSAQTEFLLKSIADRLSGRQDCRRVEYKVRIDEHGVRMEPLVYVYKNRFQRQDTDKLDIVSFIHKYKMKGAPLSGFVFGTYEYQLSADGKRRKWRRHK